MNYTVTVEEIVSANYGHFPSKEEYVSYLKEVPINPVGLAIGGYVNFLLSKLILPMMPVDPKTGEFSSAKPSGRGLFSVYGKVDFVTGAVRLRISEPVSALEFHAHYQRLSLVED